MVFWKKTTAEELERKARQDASIKALEAGDIPLAARERLEEQLRSPNHLFTSDLTTKEFLMASQAGYKPLTQVVGTAFMNISLFGASRTRSFSGELTDISGAFLHARHLAVRRLQKEAKLINATGVIGIRLTVKKHGWDSRMIEFTAIGTAIHMDNHPPQQAPFTSLLSGQEFWQLHQAGYWPVNVCMGVCAYYVWSDPDTRRLLYSWWGGNNRNNNEIPAYTQGFYNCRELALSRISHDIQQHSGDGGIGMKVDESVEDIEYEINDRTYHDFLINFSMMGTTIRKVADAPPRSNNSTLVIYDLKKKSNVTIDIDEPNFDYSDSE